MSTAQIVLLVVAIVVVIAIVAAVAMVMRRRRTEADHRRHEAAQLREDAAAGAAGLQANRAEAQQAIDLLSRTLTAHALVTDEGRAVLEVVRDYTRTWRWLLEYDENRLATRPPWPVPPSAGPTIDEARAAIAHLRDDLTRRGEAGALFGQERGDGLAGILGSIEQTFGGEPLYPSAQARAAR